MSSELEHLRSHKMGIWTVNVDGTSNEQNHPQNTVGNEVTAYKMENYLDIEVCFGDIVDCALVESIEMIESIV